MTPNCPLRNPAAIAWMVALREAKRWQYRDVEELVSVALVGVAQAMMTFKPGRCRARNPLLMHATVCAQQHVSKFLRNEGACYGRSRDPRRVTLTDQQWRGIAA
jgi:hypothetical protein